MSLPRRRRRSLFCVEQGIAGFGAAGAIGSLFTKE